MCKLLFRPLSDYPGHAWGRTRQSKRVSQHAHAPERSRRTCCWSHQCSIASLLRKTKTIIDCSEALEIVSLFWASLNYLGKQPSAASAQDLHTPYYVVHMCHLRKKTSQGWQFGFEQKIVDIVLQDVAACLSWWVFLAYSCVFKKVHFIRPRVLHYHCSSH